MTYTEASIYSSGDIEGNVETLHRAIKIGEFDIVKQIVESLPVDSQKQLINDTSVYQSYFSTALHMAVRHYHPTDCSCHTNWDAEEEPCKFEGKTPNRIEIVQYLLDKGADPTITNYYGFTPLQSSTDTGSYFSSPAPEVAEIIERYL